jgi:hypothetical protein
MGKFFRVVKEETIEPSLEAFLKVYRQMVEGASYAWSYAEVIAGNMEIIFEGQAVSPANKTLSLELAIIAAYRQNRFAAMDTCQAMISSVVDDDLAMRVRELILQYKDTSWVVGTEISKCKNGIIRTVLGQLQSAAGSG